jgi:hypothetical protein
MMRFVFGLALLFVLVFPPLRAQEIDCDVTFTNLESLSSEARDNLADFIPQLKQYINTYRWTQETFENEKIKVSINISFQGAPSGNHYAAQAFIGSQRPIFKAGRNTAAVRIRDDKWEFDYIHNQGLIHTEYKYDPLLSFIDFYMYIVLGYDFDSYKAGDGTQYFQKGLEIVNRAMGSGGSGKGWDTSPQGSYTRGQLIDELLNPKFDNFRQAYYEYHYRGLDLLYKDDVKARKHLLTALEKIAKLKKKINQNSLVIRTFFDTKYMEIAEVFSHDPDVTVMSSVAGFDPTHAQTYEHYGK